MEHMALNVSSKKGIIFLSLLFMSCKLLAQQQTEPSFKYINSNSKHLSRLDYFLGTFNPVPLEKCLFASGTFRFKVAENGQIDSMQITGNLPDTLVFTIKKRILETESRWVFSNPKNASRALKWFVLPVFVDRQMTPDCKGNKAIVETYNWLYQLFDKQNKIITTPTSFLLAPIYLAGGS